MDGNHRKLNMGKATVQQLFRAVVNAADEIKEASFVHGQNKSIFKVDTMAQGSEFYLQNIFRDQITLTAREYPTSARGLIWNW